LLNSSRSRKKLRLLGELAKSSASIFANAKVADAIDRGEAAMLDKKVLAENYVRPDEAEKVKSTIRERGSLKIIDKVTVTLNEEVHQRAGTGRCIADP
jgi:predicted ATP-dependent Lon-type protease